MTFYISNFSDRITEEDLTELVAFYGTVKRIALPKERETGRSRKFAYIELVEAQLEATVIKELDGKEWNGTSLRLDNVRPREESP